MQTDGVYENYKTVSECVRIVRFWYAYVPQLVRFEFCTSATMRINAQEWRCAFSRLTGSCFFLHRWGRWAKPALALFAFSVASYPGIRVLFLLRTPLSEEKWARTFVEVPIVLHELGSISSCNDHSTGRTSAVPVQFFGFVVCWSWVSCSWTCRFGAAALASWRMHGHCS